MPVRILHVGVGIRGRHWLDYVAAHPDFESVGLVDALPAALAVARTGREHLRGFATIAEAAAALEADAALIASPSFLHAEHALAALDAGLAVLVEKPFTIDVAEGAAVLARAHAAKKPVVVAENFRFVPVERTLRKLLRAGFLGAVSNATFIDRRRMPSDTQGSWMATIRYPQLQEIAVHHFDSLRSFFGEPESIAARVWNPPGSYAHGSSSEALILMQGGVHVQYLGTLTSHKFAWRLTIEGEAGLLWSDRKRVWWRARGKKLFRPLRNVAVPKGDGDPYPKEGTTSLLNAFRDACLHGTPAETSGADNLRTIALMQAGKTSDREGRVVRVDDVLASSTP